jgi:streptogramin lyase
LNQRKLAVFVVLVLALSFASVAKAGSTYTVGDVFLGVQSVGVEEFTSTGVFVQTINGGALGLYTTGMAFQNNGDLLVTNFSGGTGAQYDNSGNLLNATWATGIGAPESIAINAAGQVYVSSVGGTAITEYNSTGGAAIGTSIAGTRTDWIDLAADQHTMLYTDESGAIHSVDVVANTSNPDIAATGGRYALRIIPTGAFAGDILAANSGGANLISAGGTILHTYTWGANNGTDFALNIDANGTAFWTADTAGNVAEFDIATGTLLESWNSTGGANVFGLVVFGQQTASGGGGGGGGTGVPEPGTLTLLAGGLLSLGGFAKRRLLK